MTRLCASREAVTLYYLLCAHKAAVPSFAFGSPSIGTRVLCITKVHLVRTLVVDVCSLSTKCDKLQCKSRSLLLYSPRSFARRRCQP